MEQVDEVIGILELVAWVVAVVGLAAAVTFAVIKLVPSKDDAAVAAKSSGETES